MATRAHARSACLFLAAALAMASPAGAAGPQATIALPRGAVTIEPGTPIQALVNRHPHGTTYVLAAGVHRMQSVLPKDGDRFVGAPGARMNGAKRLLPPRREGAHFVARGAAAHRDMMRHGMCDAQHPLCDRPLALFVGERLLRPAERLADLAPGFWYFDEARGEVWLAEDPAGAPLELSHTPFAFGGTARGVVIENLTIERYASANQRGALGDSGRGIGWTMRANAVRWNHGYGITLGGQGQAIGNDISHNGQLGIGGGTASDMLVQDNVIAHNAWNGADCEWECGGAKWGKVDGLVVRGNHVFGNAGIGLWTDESCRDVVIERNLVEDNARAGISHEISFTAVIRHNTLRANGSARFGWGWHGQIQVQNSRDTLVEHNRLELHPTLGGNGIMLVQQDRGEGFSVRGVLVRGNTVVMPRALGLAAGWFADFEAETFVAGGNRFEGNRYLVEEAGADGKLWSVNGPVSFMQWQSGGADRDGELVRTAP